MKKYIQLILTVLMIGMMSFSSLASGMYVYDEAGLLEAEELVSLDAEAASISEKHGCGIYAIIVNDYQKYSKGDVFTTATEMYHGLTMGKGEDRDGILLMLSMEDRDYATFFYGKNAEYAFNEYGQIQLEEQFLDDFVNNNWYEGFTDYIHTCDEFLSLAEAGDPVRESHTSTYVVVVAVSIVISFIITKIMESRMRSVHTGGSTISYATNDGLQLTDSGDYYLYTTQSRRRIESSTRSGSGSRSSSHSGGGSGRSGKF